LIIGAVEIYSSLKGAALPLMNILSNVLSNKWYLAFLVVTVFFSLHLIVIRLRDRDLVTIGRN
jgi:hypothetical protein